MKNKVLFSSGPLSITSTMLRFRGRRYALCHIENVILKRPIFLMACVLSSLLSGMVFFNQDILYGYETLSLMILSTLITIAAWPWGTLYIHSKLLRTNEASITWKYNDLLKVQETIEGLISETHENGKFNDAFTENMHDLPDA